MKTPMEKLFVELEKSYGHIMSEFKHIHMQKEKQGIIDAYLKSLTDTNFNDLVGIEICKKEAEKYYQDTFND